MNNAPFYVGQKVVCVDAKTPSPRGYIPEQLQNGKTYVIRSKRLCSVLNEWCYCVGTEAMHYGWRFAPIETNYSDATNEILEKFPLTEGGQVDKVITPEKIKI